MPEMPDYMHHVETMEEGKTRFWCDVPYAPGWNFQSAEHVAAHGRHGGRMIGCPACVKAIVSGLMNGLDAEDVA